MFSLKNKVILISGATSGIGEQCSITCSKMGANVVLFGRKEEKLKNILNQLDGNNHLSYAQDIRDIDQFDTTVKKIVEKFGAIDGFIHSAGIQKSIPLRLHNKEIYKDLFDINAIGGFEICRIISRKSNFNENGGSIVFISSIRGLYGTENQIGYAASKGAINAGARSLAIELANRNIRVNTISPGMVEDTEMTKNFIKQIPSDWVDKNKLEYPLGWVSAQDIANSCVFLLSNESKKITGTNIIIDGGFSTR